MNCKRPYLVIVFISIKKKEHVPCVGQRCLGGHQCSAKHGGGEGREQSFQTLKGTGNIAKFCPGQNMDQRGNN